MSLAWMAVASVPSPSIPPGSISLLASDVASEVTAHPVTTLVGAVSVIEYRIIIVRDLPSMPG